jgi:hypothetical protein
MNVRAVEREGGLTLVAEDASGKELGRVSAEWRAECHAAVDNSLTPSAKWELLKLLHDGMEKELRMRNVREVVTWFAAEEPFCRRLLHLGWVRSVMIPFVREVR